MIIFDLDGTLSIVGDRVKFLRRDPKDWDSFYDACDQDTVNGPVATIFRALTATAHDLKIITGRRESTRGKTLYWLHSNLLFIESHNLVMRPDGDFRHDTILKPDLAARFLPDIEMVFEDRKSMVDKWRQMGICCFQVAEGDF